MSPFLFSQAVSVPLGLSERAVDAAEKVLVDCREPEEAAREHNVPMPVLRQAITVILRQAYRILASWMTHAVHPDIPAVPPEASPHPSSDPVKGLTAPAC